MNKTFYLRPGDEEKWNQIEKKSEFIHQALNWEALAAQQEALNKAPVPTKDRVVGKLMDPLTGKIMDLPGVKRASELKRGIIAKTYDVPGDGKPVKVTVLCEHEKAKGQCTQFGCPHFAPLKNKK